MAPEKTKRSMNGREDCDYEPLNYRRRNPLGDDDVLRTVVYDYVGPAGCAGMLKLFTHPAIFFKYFAKYCKIIAKCCKLYNIAKYCNIFNK